MRRIFTIFFLFILCRLIYGQEYYKFPTSADQPVWGIKQTIHDRMEETETISYFFYTMIGDTIIRDSMYTKVYELKDTLINAENIESYECSIRESFDSCIYRISNGDTLVYKLFDYSLKINDTAWLDTDAGLMNYQLADKIPISLSDEIHTEYIGTFDRWIDGIGSTSKAIDWYELPKPGMIDYTYEMKTFKRADELIYGEPFSNYLGEVTSIPGQNNFRNINIYPNPCKKHTSLIVENIQRTKRILIRNNTGKIVFDKEGSGKESLKIDTRSFHKGLYVLSVYDKEGRISNCRIVIY